MTTHRTPLDEQVDLYRRAGERVMSLISGVSGDQWNSPALGPWTVRTLVGHIGRAFTTVTEFLAKPAANHDVHTAADYYLVALRLTDSASIKASAEQAAHALGEDPPAAIRKFRDAAVEALMNAGDPLISTAAGGMRLPADICRSALTVAIEVAIGRGDGQPVLLALTGRASLFGGFSVV